MADSDVAVELPLKAIACPDDCQDSRNQMCPIPVDVGSVLDILPPKFVDPFYLILIRACMLGAGVQSDEYRKAEACKR